MLLLYVISFCWLITWRSRELRDSTKVKKRPPLRRGKVSGRLPVPEHILKPPYVGSDLLPELSKEHQIHDEEGIAGMRAAGELAARVLEFAGTMVRVRTIPFIWSSVSELFNCKLSDFLHSSCLVNEILKFCGLDIWSLVFLLNSFICYILTGCLIICSQRIYLSTLKFHYCTSVWLLPIHKIWEGICFFMLVGHWWHCLIIPNYHKYYFLWDAHCEVSTGTTWFQDLTKAKVAVLSHWGHVEVNKGWLMWKLKWIWTKFA